MKIEKSKIINKIVKFAQDHDSEISDVGFLDIGITTVDKNRIALFNTKNNTICDIVVDAKTALAIMTYHMGQYEFNENQKTRTDKDKENQKIVDALHASHKYCIQMRESFETSTADVSQEFNDGETAKWKDRQEQIEELVQHVTGKNL